MDFLLFIEQIDRKRALERQAKVYRGMKDFTNYAEIADYIIASLNSFQNLNEGNKKEIKDVIDDYVKVDGRTNSKL